MRIALISDIHGNHLALRAVLADAQARRADRVACLGDVATLGPDPCRVLAELRRLGCPCIMGNHDAFLLQPDLVERYTRAPVVVEAIDWCRAQLSDDDLRFVRGFRPRLELPFAPGRALLLFHGSPDSHTQDLLSTTPAKELDRLLGARGQTVMAGGHTHIQMLRQHGGQLLVNPGSVGMPFREYVAGARPEIMPYAEYAIVEAQAQRIGVELCRVQLDKRALRDRTHRWPDPPRLLRDDMLQHYA